MHAATRNGRLTGDVSGPLTRPEGKLDFVARVVAQEGIAWRDVVVVGDDVNNLDVMRRAGLSVGFHASYAVRREADCLVEEDDLWGILPYVIHNRLAAHPRGAPLATKPWHRELLRKILHLTAAASPFLLSRFPVATSALLLWGVGVYVVLEACRINGLRLPVVHWLARCVMRRRERREAAMGPLTLALGVFVAFWCLPRPIALASILIAAVGDSLAAVVGSHWGRVPWPHNASKTLEGSIAFLFSAVFCAAVYLPLDRAMMLAFLATAIESLQFEDWDNFVTPVGAGAGLAVILTLL
jgi:dolichol kinase